MPELKNYKGSSVGKTFLVQNVGMMLGMGAMLVISIFEEHIRLWETQGRLVVNTTTTTATCTTTSTMPGCELFVFRSQAC